MHKDIATLTAHEIVSVQPMAGYVGEIFNVRSKPDEKTLKQITKVWYNFDESWGSQQDYKYEKVSREVFDMIADYRTQEIINARIKPGDVIWTFNSPQWTWSSLCGRGGILVKRDDEVVAVYMLRFS